MLELFRGKTITDDQAEMTNQPLITDTLISPLIDNDIEDFVQIVRQYWLEHYGKELNTEVEAGFRGLLSKWNTFLLSKKDNQPTCAIISWSTVLDIEMFLSWWENELGCSLETMEVDWIHRWIPRWNKFLQIRQGVPVVTRFGLLFTLVGLLLYVVDMVTDIVTAITYAYAGQYWKFAFTLLLVYGSIIVQTVWKWHRDGIDKSCPFVGLQDFGSLITNWSGFQECWTLFRVERLLHKSAKTNAKLVLELQDRRRNVALLKITEGICEACPQAILQVYLLLNSLEGNLTLTTGFRIVSVMISICSAGAAVFNWKKSDSILDNKEISIPEMVVLLAWVVPITASRLLSTGLLLVIQPYVGLVCIIFHIVLYTVYLIIATEYCRTFKGVLYACMVSTWFFMSPFNVIDSFTYRVIPPAIHFVGNVAATLTWALNTTLLCTHPVLYACIIITDCTFFTTGIIFSVIYSKCCY